MDIPTRNLSEYIKDAGINLTRLSEKTGITYFKLYNSLSGGESKNTGRDLKAGEYLTICQAIGADPMRFAEEEKAPAGYVDDGAKQGNLMPAT